jgi:hypothetical protein
MALRKIFVSKREEVKDAGQNGIKMSFIVCTPHPIF